MTLHQVADTAANKIELIIDAAKLLGKSSHKLRVFKAIYKGKSPVKYVTDLIKATGLIRTRVLDAGMKLVSANICVQVKKGETGYQKLAFYSANKKKILSYAANPGRMKGVATKRNVKVSLPKGAYTRINLPRVSVKSINVKYVTIDDLDSFAAVKKVKANEYTRLSETAFKGGVVKLVGKKDVPKDWGGEQCDLFTDQLIYKGKRILAAFAFKGPGMTGKLTPGKMGKNGDQIQRLAKCGADLFVIQYWRDIDQSVYEQLAELLKAKSFFTKKLLYCIIDGSDSTRLIKAYPKQFTTTKRKK